MSNFQYLGLPATLDVDDRHALVSTATLLLGTILVTACWGTTAAAEADCPDWTLQTQSRHDVQVEELTESSGLAWHPMHPDTLWTHNDSGNAARLYGISLSGEHRVTLELPEEVSNTDWEDIAAGPCPDDESSSCLAIGDIGDNAEEREQILMYWVALPASIDDGASDDPTTLDAELRASWQITYEDGPRNAEAMFLAPDGNNIWIVEKSADGDSGVYTVDADATESPRTASRVGSVDIDHSLPPDRMITGATRGPDGEGVLLRTYMSVVWYEVPSEETFESWHEASPRAEGTPMVWQSEAITLVDDDRIAMSGESSPAPLLWMEIVGGCD